MAAEVGDGRTHSSSDTRTLPGPMAARHDDRSTSIQIHRADWVKTVGQVQVQVFRDTFRRCSCPRDDCECHEVSLRCGEHRKKCKETSTYEQELEHGDSRTKHVFVRACV